MGKLPQHLMGISAAKKGPYLEKEMELTESIYSKIIFQPQNPMKAVLIIVFIPN